MKKEPIKISIKVEDGCVVEVRCNKMIYPEDVQIVDMDFTDEQQESEAERRLADHDELVCGV